MNVITNQKLNTLARDLELTLKNAKRRLFEFETMASMYELQNSKTKSFKGGKSLINSLKK